MCGIVGYIGKSKALPILIEGLKKLEYRGYDSAGVAYSDNNGQINISKAVGRIVNLESKINLESDSYIGIGHTRWATHGGVTEINCHPHKSNNITIVHNGILENYQELKNFLIDEGYSFSSDTDTEVACCYIDYVYNKSKSHDMAEILYSCMQKFVGSYAIAGLIDGIDNQIFVMKKDSPLVVALGDDGIYIASDISAYSENTSRYFILEDMEYGVIGGNDITIYRDNKKQDIEFKDVEVEYLDSGKGGFEHYMLKEMHEQKDLVNKWYQYYFVDNNIDTLVDISKYKRIHIVGCGTAYHAGLVGKNLLECYGDTEVLVFIASEYRYQKLFVDKDTLVIVISQSGETADSLACVKKVKEYGASTLGIVNVKDSSIARLVDGVIYTNALTEVAVASTKAYTAQVYVLSMLATLMAVNNKLLDLNEVKESYHNLSNLISKGLDYNYSNIVDLIYDKEHLFYLGRNIDYTSVMEGSLKLKEISYIHSEAMPAGELKHGTISLMEDNTTVIVMATLEDLAGKTISNIKEVKSRGAKVILLTTEEIFKGYDINFCDEVILVSSTSYYLQPIVNIVYLQMIAYNVSKRLGLDIDKPRNLAKSVTVE